MNNSWSPTSSIQVLTTVACILALILPQVFAFLSSNDDRHTLTHRRFELRVMDLPDVICHPKDTLMDPGASSSSSTSALASLRSSVEYSTILFRIQHVGEDIFAAMIFVAMVQAMVALVQYRTNPSGQLINPPGLTFGTATPATGVEDDKQNQEYSPGIDVRNGEKLSGLSLFMRPMSSFPLENLGIFNSTTTSMESSQYARTIHHINRWLVLLIPVASQKLGWLLRRNTHLFHLGFIISLAGLFDVPNRWFATWEERHALKQRRLETSALLKNDLSLKSSAADSFPALNANSTSGKPIERIIVIGDSLAVGLGSVNIFDSTKNNSVPFRCLENVDVELTAATAPGPVFPRVLAETLANHFGTNVHWRSAGVDGGDTALIQEYCLDVVKEETEQGRAPDAVVILCGVNDLKYFVSNPFRAAGPRVFRHRLRRLLGEIQSIAPRAKIILPMFPTQNFRANSPLNIFPLNFFLDVVVGFWDSQKKLVADRYPSDKVFYLGLRPTDIYDWYQHQRGEKAVGIIEDAGLIAADGIHPNAKCYALWAKFLGEQLITVTFGYDKT